MRGILLAAVVAFLLFPSIGLAEDECWELRCQPAPSWCVMGETAEGKEILTYGHGHPAPIRVECPVESAPDWMTVEGAHSVFFSMDPNLLVGMGWTNITLYRYFTGVDFLVRAGLGSQVFDSYEAWVEATE